MMRISKAREDITGQIVLPASKSISNRLLILRHHYGPNLKIQNLSLADDTVLLNELLEMLKSHLAAGSQGILRLDAHNSGTVFRFLAALLSISRGKYYLTGSDRMKQRPVGPLVETLAEMGAEIEYAEKPGFPPLLIKGRNITGGRIGIDSSQSSQFLSALLLIAPVLENGMIIHTRGDAVSQPYITMTLKILEDSGIRVSHEKNEITVFPKGTVSAAFRIEPDWSSASFWYLLISIAHKGELFFPGLHKTGMQGDEKAALFFEALGIETIDHDDGLLIRFTGRISQPSNIDFSDCPDLALPVMLALGAAGLPVEFSGLERLRLKESDRLVAFDRELGKTGLKLAQTDQDKWTIRGEMKPGRQIFIEDDGDHRVAMTFACLAATGYTVSVENPAVVSKSYPGFWKDLESAGFDIR
jgi:3-phosphoshikimate 1-carboxyvinyltransferase